MMQLRMTDRGTSCSSAWLRRRVRSGRALAFALALGCMAAAGCGQRTTADNAPPSEEAVPQPVLAELPPPATDRIEYDSQTRTLVFYELPESARWMVRRPNSEIPDLAGPDHRLPEGIDPQHTFVFYRRPGGQQSRAVSLAQIQAARQMHQSN